jgi:hypothetical protein
VCSATNATWTQLIVNRHVDWKVQGLEYDFQSSFLNYIYHNLVSGLRFCVLFQAIFMLFLGRMIPTNFLAQAGSHPTAAQCLARPGLDLPMGLVWPCGWTTMEQCDEHPIHPNTLRGMKHGMLRIPKLNRGVVRKSSN